MLVYLAVGGGLLALPTAAHATRAATEQEMAAFRNALVSNEKEEIGCAVALRGGAAASSLGPCVENGRPDYAPQVSEGRVSTLDETWATAYVTPVPHLGDSAATMVFRKLAEAVINEGVPETRIVWRIAGAGEGCDLGANWSPRLMPDLVASMGCTPVIPTKVRCLDKFRRSLLALDEPRQCAVSGPPGSSFAGWMNIRELRWRNWGDDGPARAIGVLRQVPPRLLRDGLATRRTSPSLASAEPLAPISVRLVASGLTSCGTAFYYSTLRVKSAFGRFAISLPTCPDVFFAPNPSTAEGSAIRAN